MRFIAVCAILFPVLRICFGPVADPDLWWHLKTAEVLLQRCDLPAETITRIWLGLRFPVTDPFSYTATEPWRIYAWLPEILFYTAWRMGELPGIQMLFALLLTLFGWRFWILLSILQPRPALGFAFTLFTTWVVGASAGPRPQLFSYILLCETMAAVLLHARTGSRRIYFLPPIFLLWANCHILFPLGLAFVGVYLGGRILVETSMLDARCWMPDDLKKHLMKITPETLQLGMVLLIAIAACMVNPYGPGIFAELSSQMGEWLWTHITELLPPKPRYLPDLAMYVLLGISMIWISRWGKDLGLWEWALILGSFYLAFKAVKFLPLPFLVALPILYSHGRFEQITHRDDFRLPPALMLAIPVLLFLGIYLNRFSPKIEPSRPEGAVAFLLAHPQEGNLANHYNDGGYIIWKLWPRKKTFIDGRAQIFSADFLKTDYSALTLENPGWENIEKTINQFNIRVVLWPKKFPLGLVLEKSGWLKIYSDDKSVVLTRP